MSSSLTPRRYAPRRLAIAVGTPILLITIVIVIVMGGSSCESDRDVSDRISTRQCQQNLKEIYTAIEGYARVHNVLPESFVPLIQEGFLRLPVPSAGVINPLVCPGAPGEASDIPETTENWLSDVRANRNVSYRIIVGEGRSFDKQSYDVIAEETSGDNHRRGRHLLHMNGTITFVKN